MAVEQHAGLFFSSMDMDPADDAEFNNWFDGEHLAERAAIEGFLNARRYKAIEAARTYFSIYLTSTFDVLDGPAYRHVLANQTERSKKNMAKFIKPGRTLGRILSANGGGWGACVCLLTLSPKDFDSATEQAAMARLVEKLQQKDQVVATYFMVPDLELSRPLGGDPNAALPEKNWFIVIEATGEKTLRELTASADVRQALSGMEQRAEYYQFLWGLDHEAAVSL